MSGAPGESIVGGSEGIEPSGKAATGRFSARAEMRRYRASVVTDELSGAVIVYNNPTDVFTMDGKKKAAASGPGLRPSNSLGGASK